MAHRQGRRGFGIRSRLLVLMAVPTVALLGVTAFDVARAARVTQEAAETRQLVEAGGRIADLVHDVQVERGASVHYLVTAGDGEAELEEARRRTDLQLAALAEADAEGVVAEIVDFRALTMPGLAAQRRAVTAMEVRDREAREWYDGQYTELQQVVIDAATRIQRLTGDADLRDRATNLVTLAGLKELAFQEQALVEPALAGRALTGSQRVALEANAAAQDSQVALWTSTAPAGAVQRYGAQLEGTDGSSTNLLGDLRPGVSGFGSGADEAAGSGRAEAVQARLADLAAVERGLQAEALEAAAQLEAETANELLLLVGIGVIVVLVGVLLALITTRSLVRPMRQLDAAARRLRERLPAVVEEIQHSGAVVDAEEWDAGVAEGAPPELARLSEALDEVGAVAVDVAAGQARLRASISEMFTNFARRNQRLLDRQLSLIDALEADEPDPDRLAELFDLDHLSTRMRRNAESLLVLAGTDPSPAGAAPLDLVDVIRVAVSEIEDYERVEIAADGRVRISGRAVSSLAHLLAELLENATTFSPPTAPVRVDTVPRPDGTVEVVVTDGGIGMEPDELAAANERIADPPLIDAAASRLLGFFVVGRLARKLDVEVRLEPAHPRGLRAVVTVPAALVVGGTPASPASARVSPAAAPAAPAPAPEPSSAAATTATPPVVPQTSATPTESRAPAVASPAGAAAELVAPAPEAPAPVIPPTAADEIHRRTEGPAFVPTAAPSDGGLTRRTRRAAPAPEQSGPARPTTPLSPDTVAATLASLMGGWRQAETEHGGTRAPAAAEAASRTDEPRTDPVALPRRGAAAGALPRRDHQGPDTPVGDVGSPQPTAATTPATPTGPDTDEPVEVEALGGSGPDLPVPGDDAPVEPQRSGSLWSKARRTPRPTPTSWSTPWPTEENGR